MLLASVSVPATTWMPPPLLPVFVARFPTIVQCTSVPVAPLRLATPPPSDVREALFAIVLLVAKRSAPTEKLFTPPPLRAAALWATVQRSSTSRPPLRMPPPKPSPETLLVMVQSVSVRAPAL